MKLKTLLPTFLFLISLTVLGQTEKKVLFIGNSYTAVNNLPGIVSNMANSTGDILTFDSSTPGGYRFLNHATNSTTLQKIQSNDWDYVVLQEQSQLPAFPESQKITELYPYAEILVDSIRANDSCTEPMFYMTWGRENGDASNCANAPWFCTYESMDDSIRATYIHMAEMYHTALSPVGAVWRYLRENNPEIDLYSGDGSHPSMAGSYAAGCAFYASIYQKDPTLITWNPSLSEAEANTIKAAAKLIVYDQLSSWDYTINPATADFIYETDAGTATFTNTSAQSDSTVWSFGDGDFSTDPNPAHTYSQTGTFDVSLVNYKCGRADTVTQSVTLDTTVNIEEVETNSVLTIYPNPATNKIKVKTVGNYRNISYTLTDVSGRQLFQKTHAGKSITVDLSGLSDGLYLLTIDMDGKRHTERLFKGDGE